MVELVKNFNYVAFDTGYTSRLLKKGRLDKIREEMVDIYDRHNGANESSSANESIDDNLLFIFDDCWGDGLYPISKKEDDVNKVFNKLKEHKMQEGVIVFKCDTLVDIFRLCGILMHQHYCACFCIENLYDMRQIDDIVILKFDTESG